MAQNTVTRLPRRFHQQEFESLLCIASFEQLYEYHYMEFLHLRAVLPYSRHLDLSIHIRDCRHHTETPLSINYDRPKSTPHAAKLQILDTFASKTE